MDSHTPVEEFKLFFRKLPRGPNNGDGSGFSEQLQPLQHQSQQQRGRKGFYIKVSIHIFRKSRLDYEYFSNFFFIVYFSQRKRY